MPRATSLIVGSIIGALLTVAPTQANHPPGAASAASAERCESVDGITRCSHLDDAPPGVTLGRPLVDYPQFRERPDDTATLAPARTEGIECYGDGTTGLRVQPVYGYSTTDRSASVLPDITNTYIPRIESEFNESAKETGGERHVRFVTDADCNVQVAVVKLPAAVLDGSDFGAFVTAMRAAGFNRSDRVYVLWADASALCGVGWLYADDKPINNKSAAGPTFSRIDLPCWGYAESHELVHNLGGVQRSAPHSTLYGHCTDEWDRMCYDDRETGEPSLLDGRGQPTALNFDNAAPGGPCVGKLPTAADFLNTGHDRRFDCAHDDYFSTDPGTDSYLATHWNVANSPFLAAFPSPGPAATGAYHPLAVPFRLTDTRSSLARPPAAMSISLRVTGTEPRTANTPPLPTRGVAAVVLNVTAAAPVSDGFLSVRPSSDVFTPPTVSNLNYAAGRTAANLVTVPVAANGLVEVYAVGQPYVIVDILGWYADAAGYFAERSSLHPLPPARILDTRAGLGGASLGPGSTMKLAITGQGGVPTDHVGAVVLNLTAVDATAGSYLTVWASDAARPIASNLNFAPGSAVANLVIAKVAIDGTISIFNESGTVQVIADVAGWFDDGSTGVTGGAVFHAVAPTRVLDTRPSNALGPQRDRALAIAGSAGVPAGAVAVVANVTAVEPTGGGYLTVWPTGSNRPTASSVNFLPGQTVANLAYAALGGGSLDIFNAGDSTHVLVDVAGWFG